MALFYKLFYDASLRDVVANVLDCDIVVSKFELWSFSSVHLGVDTLGKDMNSLDSLNMGWIVPLLPFFKDGFGIK